MAGAGCRFVLKFHSRVGFLSRLSPAISRASYQSSDSGSRAEDQYEGNPIKGFQSREHEFQQARSHDMAPRSTEELEKEAADLAEQNSEKSVEDRKKHGLDKYENMSSVSLSGVMQSNVPEPFNAQGRNPTHLNMPGGGVKMQERYTSSNMHRVHPSKQYSTDARSSMYKVDYDPPCPQGVQGLDCEQYKLWMKNCQQSGMDCTEQIELDGRKTLAQIFQEQEKMIYDVVSANAQEVEIDAQGVQGSDCSFYDEWLINSSRYKIGGKKPTSDAFYQQRQHYSTSAKGSHEVGNDSDKQLSQRQKLKRTVKEYGATVVVFHIGISLMSLGGFYLAVSSGIDMVGLLEKIGLAESMIGSKAVAGTSTFVVAYAVHKVFAPVRIAITLTCTPIIVHYFRRIGFLKVPKP